MIIPGFKNNAKVNNRDYFGIWVFNDGGLCPMCSHCRKYSMNVSAFCPNCGALIVNEVAAINFQKESFDKITTEEEKND